MTLSKAILLKAALLATVALPMLTASAFGQQEVDPSWYDPWAPAVKVVVRPAQVKSTDSQKPRRISSVSAVRPKTTKPARIAVDHHSERTPAVAGLQPIR
jgi:hypothetical protein